MTADGPSKRSKNPKPTPTIYAQDFHLAARYSVCRATIWRWNAEGKLPPPIKLSTGCTRWRLADLEAFEAGKGIGGATGE